MRIYKAKYQTTAEQIVREFLYLNRSWFELRENSFYQRQKGVEKYLMHWANTGEFGPDYDDHVLIMAERKLQEYVESCFDEIKDETKKTQEND